MAPNTPKPAKRKATAMYQMPEKITEGTILTTLSKKQFRVGKAIGSGGFGEIYLCSEDISKPVGDDADRAMKIEPHENGPLFVEMNFYIRAASPEAVDNFKKANGIPSLGMPCHRGSGSTTVNGIKHRFLVMDRFGKDIEKLCSIGKSKLNERISYNLAIKIIDVLEYIHYQGYIHNDIKSQNLLIGHGKGNENDVYVVDFGLVTKYMRSEKHVTYAPDPKKAHNGTIEYLSRDAHIGALGRRSDFEVLGFNIVHWMSGTLPWMNLLGSPDSVHAAKRTFMSNIPAALKSCFGVSPYPDVLEKYLLYVGSLKFEAKPDYDKMRQIFKDALKKAKFPLDGKLDLNLTDKSPTKGVKKTPSKNAKTPLKQTKTPSKQVQKALPSPEKTPKSRRAPTKRSLENPSGPEQASKKPLYRDSGTQTSPAFVIAAKAAKRAMKLKSQVLNMEEERVTPKKTLSGTSTDFSNPTPAMAQMLAKRAASEAEKNGKKRNTPASGKSLRKS